MEDRVSEGFPEGRPIMCSFPSINKMTKGFREGELAVIASRPYVEKAAFALKLAREMTFESGERVSTLYYSPEKEVFLSAGFGSESRKYVEGTDIKAIFIDCTMLDFSEAGKMPRIAKMLRHFAQELNIAVFCLCTLGEKRGKDSVPKLEDLGDCGFPVEDADLVLLLDEPEVRYSMEHEVGVKLVRVIFGKLRNGVTGMYPFRFREEDLEFEDMAENHRKKFEESL